MICCLLSMLMRLVPLPRPLVLAVLAMVALTGTVAAETYPAHPITIVVPFPPGGSTDAMARLLQSNLMNPCP